MKCMDGGMDVGINPASVKMIQELSNDTTRVYFTGEVVGICVQGSFDEVFAKLSPQPHIGLDIV
jgi:hypothetical protein